MHPRTSGCPDRSPSCSPSSVSGMPPPRPAATCRAGTRRSPGGPPTGSALFPSPGGLHVSVRPGFTFWSDILSSWYLWSGAGSSGAGVFGCRSGPSALVYLVSGQAFAWSWLLSVTGAGSWSWRLRQGGPAARPTRVLRRRLRVFGGRPWAARRWFSSCRACQACRIRWLRTTSRVHSISGARPMSRHQPRAMSLRRGP